jgi:hypothetical protein
MRIVVCERSVLSKLDLVFECQRLVLVPETAAFDRHTSLDKRGSVAGDLELMGVAVEVISARTAKQFIQSD